jgi:bacillithiol system protein YtxJ
MADAYTRLSDASELDAAFRAAQERPVMLFKHSLTCPVSTAGLREFERWLGERSADSSVEPYLIEIQNHRDLSNAVAERTGVRHESPQALLLEGGEVAWHGSHWKITAKALAEAVDALG